MQSAVLLSDSTPRKRAQFAARDGLPVGCLCPNISTL